MLGDVGDLVAQYRGEFRFTLSGEDEAGVYAYEPAGQREGVDHRAIDDEEFEFLPGFTAICDQLIAKLIQVIGDFRVIQIISVSAYIHHALQADLAFLLRRDSRLRDVAQVGQSFGTAHQCHHAQREQYQPFHGRYDTRPVVEFPGCTVWTARGSTRKMRRHDAWLRVYEKNRQIRNHQGNR